LDYHHGIQLDLNSESFWAHLSLQKITVFCTEINTLTWQTSMPCKLLGNNKL